MKLRFPFLTFVLLVPLATPLPAGEPKKDDSPPPKQPAQPSAQASADSKLNFDDKLNFVVQGQILEADPPDRVRNVPCKVHAVRLKKDVTYVIDMVAAEMGFDSFLRLEDSTGMQLAQDDDGGGNLNARIRFRPTKDDTYLVYCSELGGREGGYTLSVKSVGPPAPAKLLPLAAPVANKPAEANGKLDANDPAAGPGNHPSKVHTVELKAGKSYVIDLTSQAFDCYLILQDAKGNAIAENDDGGDGLNSRIRYQVANGGTFRLVATTFNGRIGEYTIRVTED